MHFGHFFSCHVVLRVWHLCISSFCGARRFDYSLAPAPCVDGGSQGYECCGPSLRCHGSESETYSCTICKALDHTRIASLYAFHLRYCHRFHSVTSSVTVCLGCRRMSARLGRRSFPRGGSHTADVHLEPAKSTPRLFCLHRDFNSRHSSKPKTTFNKNLKKT